MTDQLATRTLPVLPLPNGVVVPPQVVTIALESDEATAAADAAATDTNGSGGEILLVPRVNERFARMGAIARVESTGTLPDGTRALVVRATSRARVGTGVLGATSALWVTTEPVVEESPSERARELATELRATLRALFERVGGRRLVEVLRGADDPGALADLAAWWPDLSIERKIELLEAVEIEDRVAKVLAWAKEALTELELAEQISNEVREGMDKQQREFLLRQQLAAIRKELGDDADDEGAVDEYRTKLDELRQGGGPEAVVEAVDRELKRLERTPPQQIEHGWIRTWLDTVLGVPWTDRTDDQLDVAAAREVLDADHTGLDEVKDRIVEFLAVRKLRADRGIDEEATARRKPGAIIALVGPPGVGKTSLGESVARALGRKFVRVALGGIRDEAEVRGHRRTYVGAQPGRIVRALSEAGTMNPVLLLDELDKVGADWRGDPSSALLEVLDPAQNHTFRDHYLEVDLDLSDVLFLATANVMESIPAPLLDRLEIVRLDGYTEDEKVAIARDHLLARQVRANGLHDGEVSVTDAALRRVVGSYTREAGVRGLERLVGKALRKVAVRIATGDASPPVAVDDADVVGLLGRE
ncbi:MAG: AAA family ATPase, partial [Acidimicrobiales bacterium]